MATYWVGGGDGPAKGHDDSLSQGKSLSFLGKESLGGGASLGDAGAPGHDASQPLGADGGGGRERAASTAEVGAPAGGRDSDAETDGASTAACVGGADGPGSGKTAGEGRTAGDVCLRIV
jgi:hypothetical protein